MRRIESVGVLVIISFLLVISNALKSHLRYVTDERLTSDVNLERFYILEEDILTNVEALLRDDYFEAADEESEEEHLKHKPDLTVIQSAINHTKSIHTEAGRDISTYLSHPVNIFHLLRRLDLEWKKGLNLVLNTKLCRKWNVPGMIRHLRYIQKRLPGVDTLNAVIKFMAHQIKTFRLDGQEVALGKVGDQLATQPLSVDDQYIVAQSLYEQEHFQLALPWLEMIANWFSKADQDERAVVNFHMSSVLKMMATTYYQVNNPSASVTAMERLLEDDPSNELAKANLAFFQNKVERLNERGDTKKKVALSQSKFARLCNNNVTKVSRYNCVLEPVTGDQSWYFHKKEILKHNPPIYMYHDFISTKTSDELKDYSFNTISDRAWTSDAFRTPRLRLVFNYPFIYPLKLRQKVRRIVHRVRSFPRSQPQLLKAWGPFQVFTSGLQGMHLRDHLKSLDLVPLHGEVDVGAFFLFLSEAKQGGRVVMTSRNLVIQPTKGSVLVYHTNRSKAHSFCPAIGGSVWTAVQPYYNNDPRQSPRRRRRR